MSRLESLLDVRREMNVQAEYLSQAVDTLNVLTGALEEEGYQQEGEIDKEKAVNFVLRFPAFLSAMRLTVREIDRIAAALNNLEDTVVERR